VSSSATVPESTYVAAAAVAHVACGALAVLGAVLFGFPAWTGAVAVLVVAAIKETVVDPYDFERNPFWTGTLNSGAFDLAMYPVGVGLAFLALVLAHKPL
jgi:hypothetical protein